MKKTTFFTVLLFLATVSTVFAQFTRDDIKFWIGEGDLESYFVADFRDGTPDPSFAWGFRYDAEDDLSFADMFLLLSAAEPNFDHDSAGGFVSDVYYNSHAGEAGIPDYWSTWSGENAETMEMNSGISETLEHERWYGISYGFSPIQHPTITYPAYSSQWFSADELEYSYGEGNDYAVFVLDFVDSDFDDPETYAWKISFDESIEFKEALQLIEAHDPDFSVVLDTDGNVISVQYMEMEAAEFLLYKGTNMSDWVPADNNLTLENEGWIGLVKGEGYTRRPFIPVAAPEGQTVGVASVESIDIKFFPNPTRDFINLSVAEPVDHIIVRNILGSVLIKENLSNRVDVSNLADGTYLLEIIISGKRQVQRFIKR